MLDEDFSFFVILIPLNYRFQHQGSNHHVKIVVPLRQVKWLVTTHFTQPSSKFSVWRICIFYNVVKLLGEVTTFLLGSEYQLYNHIRRFFQVMERPKVVILLPLTAGVFIDNHIKTTLPFRVVSPAVAFLLWKLPATIKIMCRNKFCETGKAVKWHFPNSFDCIFIGKSHSYIWRQLHFYSGVTIVISPPFYSKHNDNHRYCRNPFNMVYWSWLWRYGSETPLRVLRYIVPRWDTTGSLGINR